MSESNAKKLNEWNQDQQAFQNYLNKVVDWDVLGTPITNFTRMKFSLDPDLEKNGIANLDLIKQAFHAGRQSMRLNEEPRSDEEIRKDIYFNSLKKAMFIQF